VAVIATSSN